MTTLDSAVFGPDPWWISLIKVVIVFVLLLVWTIFNVWFERRVVAKMQHRKGPILNPVWAGGLGQAVADGTKLIFKEDFRPAKADKWVFTLAPYLSGVAAFTSWAVIPIGGQVTIFGHQTYLQLTDLPVSVLFILAVASVGIYGIVLAGWASNSTYALLGAMRSSAQMISYEVAMGLSLVAVFMMSGTMSTHGIVEAQQTTFHIGSFNTHLPQWYAIMLVPSFVIYAISMVGESNRAPFDLPEAESELVSGYITEYSGFRYAAYFMAEYINMATLSALCTTLFLGGYGAPWPFNLIGFLNNGWVSPLWFFLKVQILIFGFVWLRGTLPRFRYDQFMHLGWKWLIPISLVWITVVAVLKAAQNAGAGSSPFFWLGILAVAAGVIALFVFGSRAKDKPSPAPSGDFDAFAGGYPVPPMPGQRLPEFAGVVASTASEARASATESSSDADQSANQQEA